MTEVRGVYRAGMQACISEKTLCILILRPLSDRMMIDDSVAMYGAKLMIDVESKTPSINPNIIPKAIRKKHIRYACPFEQEVTEEPHYDYAS